MYAGNGRRDSQQRVDRVADMMDRKPGGPVRTGAKKER